MKKVAMKVNSANLVKSLKFSFSNKSTHLSELMQNARRAKATQVVFEFAPETKTLRITDDGCGIGSIETLLTVAESGWDMEVVETEHPFGMGFLSALFACNHITIVSKGGQISADTNAILSFKPVTVQPVDDWDGITSITLVGVNLEAAKVESLLKKLCRGFPIPVILNGVTLERKHALDSGLNFIDTELGAVYLSGVETPDGTHSAFEVYLQGLPIYSSYVYSNDFFATQYRHVIHLDSACHNARLPDRDKLVDEQEVVNKIQLLLKAEIEQHFTRMKAKISAVEFVQFYSMIRYWQLLHLLNDVPVVPIEVLKVVEDYPVCDTEAYGDFMPMPKQPMTRAELEVREIVTITDDIDTDGSARFMFAWKRDCLVYDGGLDNGHWLHPLIRHLNDEEFSLELVNETHSAWFQGDWVDVGVRFCEAYRIHIGNDSVETSADALYQGSENGGRVIMPKLETTAYVLKQISSYRSEYEDHQESTHAADMDAFSSFVVANTSNDPAEALQRLLPGFSGCPSLFGKAFVVTINDTGFVASVATAVC